MKREPAPRAAAGVAPADPRDPRELQQRDTPSFDDANAALRAGRYADALRSFDALSANDDRAALLAADCAVRVNGCNDAIRRYEALAQRAVSKDIGDRARLGAANCHKTLGNYEVARARYRALDGTSVASEANRELRSLTPRAAPAKPAGATTEAKPGQAAPPAQQEQPQKQKRIDAK